MDIMETIIAMRRTLELGGDRPSRLYLGPQMYAEFMLILHDRESGHFNCLGYSPSVPELNGKETLYGMEIIQQDFHGKLLPSTFIGME